MHEVTQGIKAEVVRVFSSQTSQGKLKVLKKLGGATTAAIGNGYNDHKILQEACLGIAVIGKEGAALNAFLNCNIIVNNIADALDLLLHPLMIKATLRR